MIETKETHKSKVKEQNKMKKDIKHKIKVKVKNKERIFWLDNYEGTAQGGFYTRCNLKEHIQHFKEKGYKVVGIKPCEENWWNLQFICERIEDLK